MKSPALHLRHHLRIIGLASLVGAFALSVNATAATGTVLHSFFGFKNTNDGSVPMGGLILAKDGNFYGTTQQGGALPDGTVAENGTIYKMTPAGVVTILYSFPTGPYLNTDNPGPLGELVQGTDGNFYGTIAGQGDAVARQGAVFQMTPAGVVTFLHNFDYQPYPPVMIDGYVPHSGLIQGKDGSYYGTTTGGGAYGGGTVYKVTVNASTNKATVTLVYSFNTVANSSKDGYYPESALIQGKDGNFYGSTTRGGVNGQGTIFKVTPAGVETTLHSFNNATEGYTPMGPLLQAKDGNFYGTTTLGLGTYGYGTVFELTPSGKFTTLHVFEDGSVSGDGGTPTGRLIEVAGALYGTTTAGGTNGAGTVYKIVPDGAKSVLTILRYFGDRYDPVTGVNLSPFDGTSPVGLALGADGNLYGPTSFGGESGYGNGTLYRISPAGTAYSQLYAFRKTLLSHDGANPVGRVIQGKDGNFYGVTSQGGATGRAFSDLSHGTVFKMTPAGTVTILHAFGDGTVANDGNAPDSGLIQAADGSFYGTTPSGGSVGGGTIYRVVINPATGAPTTTILHSYGDGTTANDGGGGSSLIQGKDGGFYGATNYGGQYGHGAAFKLTVNAKTGTPTYTIIHSFGSGTDATSPCGARLAQDSAGNLYGVSFLGGTMNKGTVYKMTAKGVVKVLHSFGATLLSPSDSYYLDGVNSSSFGEQVTSGSVVVGTDGNLYGTTEAGGETGRGMFFLLTTSGANYSILYHFGINNPDPNSPYYPTADNLIQLADGNFCGTAQGYGYDSTHASPPVTSPGAIYEISPTGAFTNLHSLQIGTINDGFGPSGGVFEGSDGAIYGLTGGGGEATFGTVYKVVKKVQKITIAAIPDHAHTDAPFTISATTTSKLTPIKFSIVSGPAKITGDTITLTGVGGVVVVQATQAGNTTYGSSTATRSFNVTPLAQTITFPAVDTAIVGQTITLAAKSDSGLTVKYSLVTTAGYTGAATITGAKIKFTKAGKIKLAADQSGNTTYAAADQVRQIVTITAK